MKRAVNPFLLAVVAALCLAAPPAGAQQITEGFTVGTYPPTGWVVTNLSSPIGAANWIQCSGTAIPPAQAGGANDCTLVNYNAGSGTATLSVWLLTPPVVVNGGEVLTFWTRTAASSTFPDRMQVRLNTANNGTNVGTLATDVGDFTTLLLDINPTYTVGGYPTAWTLFTVNIPAQAGQIPARIGFRYFVENGGPNGANSNIIGLDTVGLTNTTPVELTGFSAD